VVDYADTLEEVKTRDRNDTMRDISPLRQADDAVVIDSTHRTVDQVVDDMADRVRSLGFK
jgi:cytidylate kinase